MAFERQLKSLTVTFEHVTGDLRLTLVGKLNEDANLGMLLDELRLLDPERISLDVSPVTSINSCGIREWLLFLERLLLHFPIDFVHVGEVFIEGASAMPGLLGDARIPIKSFDVPFYCAKCDHRVVSTFNKSDVLSLGRLPEIRCSKCNGLMEADVILSEYLEVLKRHPHK